MEEEEKRVEIEERLEWMGRRMVEELIERKEGRAGRLQ